MKLSETINGKTVYECDPEKNTECRKTFCMHNYDNDGAECHMTTHPEYAWDGKQPRRIFKVCPICGRAYTERPAISRHDSKTEICPECGMHEAIAAYERSKR